MFHGPERNESLGSARAFRSDAGFRLREDKVEGDRGQQAETFVFGEAVALGRRAADATQEAGELARMPEGGETGPDQLAYVCGFGQGDGMGLGQGQGNGRFAGMTAARAMAAIRSLRLPEVDKEAPAEAAGSGKEIQHFFQAVTGGSFLSVE